MTQFETEEFASLSEQVSRAFSTVPKVDVDEAWREMQALTVTSSGSRVNLRGRRWISAAAGLARALMASGGIYIMVADHNVKTSVESTSEVETADVDDMARVYHHSTTFSNESVESVVRLMGEAYGVEVRFTNAATANLRVHLQVDSGLTLGGFVDLINNFESIDAAIVRHEGETILEIR